MSPVKTEVLDADAYDMICAAKGPEETLSDVVRRTVFEKPHAPLTGAMLLEYFQNGASGLSESYLDEVEEASRNDLPPDDPWV